jgi:hypothetical protein
MHCLPSSTGLSSPHCWCTACTPCDVSHSLDMTSQGCASPIILGLHPAAVPCCRYENIVQIRCLLEGVTPDQMLDSWHDMLPHKMKEWQLDRQEVCGCCWPLQLWGSALSSSNPLQSASHLVWNLYALFMRASPTSKAPPAVCTCPAGHACMHHSAHTDGVTPLRCLTPCAFCCSCGVQLVHLFGSVRDDWMHQDLSGWLGANAIYEGVAPVLQQLVAAEDTEVYIVTTKQVGQGVAWAALPARVGL